MEQGTLVLVTTPNGRLVCDKLATVDLEGVNVEEYRERVIAALAQVRPLATVAEGKTA